MLVTADESSADHVRYLATQARDPAPHYQHSEIGYNYRLSNLLAALGRAQLADLPAAGCPSSRAERSVPQRPGAASDRLPPEASYGVSSCWLTCITLDPAETVRTPEEVRLALEDQDIESRPTWKPMHLQPVFADEACRVDGTSERLFRTGLCLPSGSSLQ